jgi:hypothetical protein
VRCGHEALIFFGIGITRHLNLRKKYHLINMHKFTYTHYTIFFENVNR